MIYEKNLLKKRQSWPAQNICAVQKTHVKTFPE